MMNELSLEVVNQTSPYKVYSFGKQGTYIFDTENGVRYSVSFLEDDILPSSQAFQFIIANLNHQKSPRDAKLRDTIISLVDEFFNCNNSPLLYYCETSDNKQQMRFRLFSYWFSTYAKRAQFSMFSSSVKDEEGIVNYITLIIRNDNPDMMNVVSEFTETISALSHKPA